MTVSISRGIVRHLRPQPSLQPPAPVQEHPTLQMSRVPFPPSASILFQMRLAASPSHLSNFSSLQLPSILRASSQQSSNLKIVAFPQIINREKRLKIAPMKTFALLRRNCQIKRGTGALVIYVPDGTMIIPRHPRLKLSLDINSKLWYVHAQKLNCSSPFSKSLNCSRNSALQSSS